MKKIYIPILILFALVFSSCAARVVHGSMNVVTETRQVSDFSRVDICCGMELFLEKGKRENLEIEAEDNILAEIESVVRGDTLWIKFRDGYPEVAYRPNRPIRIYLTAEEIAGVEISGGGDLYAEEITTERLELVLSGGSDAEIEALKADYFDLDVSGGGDVSIAGAVEEQRIDSSGGSSYDAEDLESEMATLHVSGGGNASLWVHDMLDVDASGGSSVSYYGQPKITASTSGGSNLSSLGKP